jgi:large subunit ribosomal protein L25
MELDGKPERVLLRDVQWHPYKAQVMHIDFQRVAADQRITLKVPLHFVNQENSPAVKLSAAIVGHVMNELLISCLAADLPEFIEVDLTNLTPGTTVFLRDLQMPKGVTPVLHGKENPVVATCTVPGAVEEEPAAEAAPAAVAPAAAPAAAAKKPEKK